MNKKSEDEIYLPKYILIMVDLLRTFKLIEFYDELKARDRASVSQTCHLNIFFAI